MLRVVEVVMLESSANGLHGPPKFPGKPSADFGGRSASLGQASGPVQDVDAIFVGPNDLSAQMRGPDGIDPSPVELEAMLQRVLAAGKKTGTPVGLHVQSTADVQKRIEEGWQFIAIGSELRFMSQMASEVIKTVMPQGEHKELARY